MNRREFQQGVLATLACAWNAGQAQTPSRLRVDGDRLNANLKILSRFGRNSLGGVSRVAFSDADLEGREFVRRLMADAQLQTRIDAAGNLIGLRNGSDLSLPMLVTGSHIDSVPEGGNYDGDVGSLAAIEVATRLNEEGIRTSRSLEIVIFANEESGQTGSRALSGRLTEADLERVTHSKKTLREGIRFIGGDPDKIAAVRRNRGDIHACLELHIEQGPILDARGLQIGIVEGIVGIHRWMVTVEGFANHAGTTPMDRRQDALLAAARFIDQVHGIVTGTPGRQVGTVGWIEVSPGAPNVVPGRVQLTLEMRDLDWPKVDGIFASIRDAADAIGKATGTRFHFEEIYNNPPRPTHTKIQDLIEDTARSLEFTTLRMPSGAGHDSQSLSHITPIGMIFVPSVRGISHSAEEYTPPEAIARGADVLLNTLLRLDTMPLAGE